MTLDIALLCVYGALLYSAHNKELQSAVLQSKMKQNESDKETVKGLERALEDTKAQRAKLENYFIQKTNSVTFIEHIEQIGKGAGVELLVSSVADAPTGTSGIELNFSATGGFSGIYRLIALVEAMPHKITFKKADIQKSEADGSWKGNFAISLESIVSANPSNPALAASNDTAP